MKNQKVLFKLKKFFIPKLAEREREKPLDKNSFKSLAMELAKYIYIYNIVNNKAIGIASVLIKQKRQLIGI